MRQTVGRTVGRGASRPAVVAALIGGLAAVAVALTGRTGAPTRGPAALPNPEAAAPVESRARGIRFLSSAQPPERLIIDSVPPTQPARVLFFEGRPAEPLPGGGAVTLDGAGGIVQIDRRLTAHRVTPRIDGRQITSVAAAGDGGLWLVAGDGELLRVDARGDLDFARTDAPFIYSFVATGGGSTPYLARSPAQTGFRPVFGSTPLLARLRGDGSVGEMLASGVVPRDFLLTHLASAGRLAISDSLIYFAPFIRDQVIALSPAGDTLWVASRKLPQPVGEPTFSVENGDPTVDYAPVNLGIALGPDDRYLYVLGVPGFTVSQSRLDVYDRSTGDHLRSAILDDPLPTLAADDDGRVYVLDEFRLLTGVPASERQPLQSFDLERLDGQGRISSADVRGKVVLINFWASWCVPCRVEMPALDSLRRSIDDPDFVFLTFNEDVRIAPARAFIGEFGFDFPVLLGRGDLRETYHYVGLPFTVLIDREGRVVNRWIGFAGEEQIHGIRAVAVAELERGAARIADMKMGASRITH